MARHRRRNRLNVPVTLFVATVATLSAMRPAFAGTPTSESASRAPQQSGEPELDYNGEDFTRPESKITIKFEGKTSGATTETERETLFLQGEVAFYLESDWRLDWLIQLPVVSKSATAEDSADSTHEFGFGDAEAQVILVRPINEHWALGFGIRLITPSAEDTIGSCPVAWCKSGGALVISGGDWPDQAATAGSLTMGSSLKGAMVSRLMYRPR